MQPALLLEVPGFLALLAIARRVRIASWNVNGIRAAWGNGLSEYLATVAPDILGVQEVKSHRAALPPEILDPPGYRTIWHSAGRPGYSGVGLFVSEHLAAANPWFVRGMGRPEVDAEGRVLTLELPDFFFVTAYFPNSGAGGRRIDYKLDFCRGIEKFCSNLERRGKPVLLAGDLNIAPYPIDVFSTDDASGTSGYLPPERAWLRGFLEGPWVDVFRRDHPEQPGHFTWWSFFDNDREENRGWRIDSFLVSATLADRVRCEIQSHVKGSDHCPVLATVE
jgi:exodeoxyribonuclease-3